MDEASSLVISSIRDGDLKNIEVATLAKIIVQLKPIIAAQQLQMSHVPMLSVQDNLARALAVAFSLPFGTTPSEQKYIKSEFKEELQNPQCTLDSLMDSFAKKTYREVNMWHVSLEDQAQQIRTVQKKHHVPQQRTTHGSSVVVNMLCIKLSEDKYVFDTLRQVVNSAAEEESSEAAQDQTESIQQAKQLLQSVTSKLDRFFTSCSVSDLKNKWSSSASSAATTQQGWKVDLHRFGELLDSMSLHRIVVAGMAGHGKSSLINKLLGEDILTSRSTGSSTTSAITELLYSGANSFDILVEYKTLADISRDIDEIIEDGVLVKSSNNKETLENWTALFGKENAKELEAAAKRVYKAKFDDAEGDEKLSNEELSNLKKKIEEIKLQVQEPYKSLLQLARKKFQENTAKSAKEKLKQFTTPSKTEPMWLIVKKVVVSGPFKNIQGAVLVDLPGDNDANRYRSRLTEEKQRSDNLWLVADSLRTTSSQSISDVLTSHLKAKSQNVLHLVSSTAVIATKCEVDEQSMVEICEELEVDPDEYSPEEALEMKRILIRNNFDAGMRSFGADAAPSEEQQASSSGAGPASGSSSAAPASSSAVSLPPFKNQSADAFDAIPLFITSTRAKQDDEVSGFPALVSFLRAKQQDRQLFVQGIKTQLLSLLTHISAEASVITALPRNPTDQLQEVLRQVREVISMTQNTSLHTNFRMNQLQFFRAQLDATKGQVATMIFQQVRDLNDFYWSTKDAVYRNRGVFTSRGTAGTVNIYENCDRQLQRILQQLISDFFGQHVPYQMQQSITRTKADIRTVVANATRLLGSQATAEVTEQIERLVSSISTYLDGQLARARQQFMNDQRRISADIFVVPPDDLWNAIDYTMPQVHHFSIHGEDAIDVAQTTLNRIHRLTDTSMQGCSTILEQAQKSAFDRLTTFGLWSNSDAAQNPGHNVLEQQRRDKEKVAKDLLALVDSLLLELFPSGASQPAAASSAAKNDDDEDDCTCGICCVNLKNTKIIPCNHIFMCAECATKLIVHNMQHFKETRCPLCRGLIRNIDTFVPAVSQ